jgi:sterol desaturase/sphingolipid hydroxylase (fatty acid hydroxylase superfamily)
MSVETASAGSANAATIVALSPSEAAAVQYQPRGLSPWRTIYGVILWGLLVAGLIATALHLKSATHEVVSSLSESFKYILPQILIYSVFSAMERILPAAGPRKSRRRYILNFQVTAFNYVAQPILAGVVGACVAAIGSHVGLGLLDLRFSTGHGLGGLLLAFLLSFFIYDFFYYWFHRFQHENRFLWQEHKLHHMDEELCALNRESPLEEMLRTTVTVPIAFLFKLDPMQGMIAASLGVAWVVFIHSNMRVPLGWASPIFAGPQVHRIHHSRLHEHHDKNFSAFFPVWDVLFGTYHHPKPDEYPPTGVHDEKEVSNFREAIMLPARAWRQMFHEWRSRRQDIISV